MRLQGKTAIVTGAGSGIGRGIAEVFAEEGAQVVLAERREEAGEQVAQAIRDAGGAARFVRCDVSVEADVRAMVDETLRAYGRVDVLVNNAGVNFVKPFEETTVEDWDRVLGVDLRGVFLCTRACIGPFLRQGGGSVVNIASVHSLAGMPGAAPYDAAKCGVVGLTRALAVEYASRGIRFNCLSPGLIDTQIWRDALAVVEDPEACLAHWRSNIPAGRIGTPREMGRVAVFLASDDASYITGANLCADGGLTALLVSMEGYRSRPLEGKE